MSSEALSNVQGLLEQQNLSFEVFFIQRKAKTESKKKGFSYTLSRLDASKEINGFFLKSAKAQVEKYIESSAVAQKYGVISDDMPKTLFKYDEAEKLKVSDHTWKKILNGTEIKSAVSLNELKKNIWCYCVKIVSTTDGGKTKALFFKKLTATSVATDTPQGFGKKIKAHFDSTDPKLVEIKTEHITFEDKFDCVLQGNSFLIFSKAAFEKIAELEDEFVELSNETLEIINNHSVVEGLEIVRAEVTSKPSMMRTLANIAKNNNHAQIGVAEIENMKQMLLQYEGRELKSTSDGKVLIENKDDVEDFLKLLNDYYKQGMVTGKTYGSNSGSVLVKRN